MATTLATLTDTARQTKGPSPLRRTEAVSFTNQKSTMPKTKAPPEFPEPGQGASMTAHDFAELIPMRDADASRGWRILYDEDDPHNPSIVYVKCHPQDGYSRTIYYRAGSQTVDQDTFQRHFKERLQEIDAPACWDDIAERIGIQDAVEHINAHRTDAALRGEVVSRG